MAYRNLVAQSCTNHAEAFQRLRDFLCRRNGTYDYSSTGIGWTLHDAVYAVDQNTLTYGDYIVVYSEGEAGGQNMYFNISYLSGGIPVQGYLYWNATTHAGVQAYGNNGLPNWTHVNGTALTLWVYGSLDAFTLVNKYTSTYYGVFAGHFPESPLSQTPVASTSSVTAGSGKPVTFASVPASWVVGKKLIVRDSANVERVTISAVDGTTVTFASFAAGYASGVKFSEEVSYCTQYNNGFGVAMNFMIDHLGAKGGYIGTMAQGPGAAAAVDGLSGIAPAIKRWQATSDQIAGPVSNTLMTVALTAESVHTDGTNSWRYFALNSGVNTLLREV